MEYDERVEDRDNQGGSEAASEHDDLMSTRSSHTSFDGGSVTDFNGVEEWRREICKSEGRMIIIGEYSSKTKFYRTIVIGPDWPCVVMTLIVILVPSGFIYLYMVTALADTIVCMFLLSMTILSLLTVFVADPGMMRNYHHARSRNWTFCEQCESFRPPKTVHCSICKVCVGGYDHHCPWTGKCVGSGNVVYFKMFVISLILLVVFYAVEVVRFLVGKE